MRHSFSKTYVLFLLTSGTSKLPSFASHMSRDTSRSIGNCWLFKWVKQQQTLPTRQGVSEIYIPSKQHQEGSSSVSQSPKLTYRNRQKKRSTHQKWRIYSTKRVCICQREDSHCGEAKNLQEQHSHREKPHHSLLLSHFPITPKHG